MRQLHERRSRDLASSATLQLVKSAEQPRARHEEVSREGIRESLGFRQLAGSLLLAGVLAQSGGLFVHMGLGQQGRGSPGTVLTRAGALLIAAALTILAVGLIMHG
jgi:hypothetical protein